MLKKYRKEIWFFIIMFVIIFVIMVGSFTLIFAYPSIAPFIVLAAFGLGGFLIWKMIF